MKPTTQKSDTYHYATAGLNSSHAYLLPAVRKIFDTLPTRPQRVFDLGCGNGSVSAEISKWGYEVMGIDGSLEGIAHARKTHPSIHFEHRSVYDDLASTYGQFDVVLSLEVIEHLYSPREFLKTAEALLRPGGFLILSTPYHGYLKNLAIALADGFDRHFMALEEHGHIKFWSVQTLSTMLRDVPFQVRNIDRVGRVPALAKSMIFTAEKPKEP
jgi:2-polyprenyl-3-methyl-5-hydroxy-6-metoxy-1,4-benzoquinol methylase